MSIPEESTREWCVQYTDNPPEFGLVHLEKNQSLADLRRYIIDWWDAEIIPNNFIFFWNESTIPRELEAHINVWSLAYENVNGLKVVEGDEE